MQVIAYKHVNIKIELTISIITINCNFTVLKLYIFLKYDNNYDINSQCLDKLYKKRYAANISCKKLQQLLICVLKQTEFFKSRSHLGSKVNYVPSVNLGRHLCKTYLANFNGSGGKEETNIIVI